MQRLQALFSGVPDRVSDIILMLLFFSCEYEYNNSIWGLLFAICESFCMVPYQSVLSLSALLSPLLSSCPTSTSTNTHWAHNYTPAIWHVFLFLPEKTNKFYLFVLNQYMAKTHYLCSAEFCVLIHLHPKFISTHAQVCMDFLSESPWTANL